LHDRDLANPWRLLPAEHESHGGLRISGSTGRDLCSGALHRMDHRRLYRDLGDLLYLTRGVSQAMETSFWEDVISVVPAIVFLICTPLAIRPPSRNFPYGFHSVVSVGHLTAALALIGMGRALFRHDGRIRREIHFA
jgi:hypothetical protein